MTATEICLRAKTLGLRLKPAGDRLAVIPGTRCPPAFAAELRQHKTEVLNLLQAEPAYFSADCAPWYYIAMHILAGEFDGADEYMIKSLTIGLRGIQHPTCVKAITRLQSASRFSSNLHTG